MLNLVNYCSEVYYDMCITADGCGGVKSAEKRLA